MYKLITDENSNSFIVYIHLQSSVSAFISPLERNEDPSNVLVPTLTAVPDSCCLRPERAEAGCGKKAFKDDDDNQAIRPQDARIR